MKYYWIEVEISWVEVDHLHDLWIWNLEYKICEYVIAEVGYGTLVSPKLDVYSYGVLLLELITGKQPVDASHGETWHIVEWVKASVLQNEGQMTDCVLDPLLLENLNVTTRNEMLFVQRIALLCTRATPTDRPTMRDVADLLKSLSQTLKDKNENGIIEHGESSTCEWNEVCTFPTQVWMPTKLS